MVPAVHVAVRARHAKAGQPQSGWVFPSTSRDGHFNKDTAKDQHAIAIERANAKANKANMRKLAYFQPYVLRHTALTELAQSGCDAFTLARIAGHSSITITQRYIHPQADAIERAFAPLAAAAFEASKTEPSEQRDTSETNQVGTKLGTTENVKNPEARKLLVRKGGLEPPRFYPPDPKSGASANSATFAILLALRSQFPSVEILPVCTLFFFTLPFFTSSARACLLSDRCDSLRHCTKNRMPE